MRNNLIYVVATAFILTGSMFYFAGDSGTETSLQKFDSENEFQNFISSSGSDLTGGTEDFEREVAMDSSSGSSGVVRSSDTNVHVKNVDEPDILKNDGGEIFYSPDSYRYRGDSNTSVFDTLPAEEFSEKDKIPENGEMFLRNDTVIFLGQNITAIDRDDYEVQWNEELDSRIESARMINDSIYLVLQKYSSNCPVRPIASSSMPCTDYYHWGSGTADTSYTLVQMDAESGEIENENGFVGESSNTVTYVTENSIHLSYSEKLSETELMTDFLQQEGDNYLDSETMNRIDELMGYDISDRSLQSEIERAVGKHFQSLDEDERRQMEKNFEQGLKEYTNDRKRELMTTNIVRFNLDLELEAEGGVPGDVNNRFSMDESSEGLRIATTVGDSWSFNSDPENDLYTLDNDLEIVGELQGMGLNESIYSARFIDDKAYIVTFRRVDPFHVIDLSDHMNPSLEGELKLPGYSSYLHPLQENRILGVGEENGSVKAVIFDVEDDNPSIVDEKILDDYYSSISRSHHAFQIDRENNVFFLPGSTGGYFFDYSEDLEIVKEVDMRDVKRAAFVNQNFYVFNDYNASVIDIDSWETVKELQFREEQERYIGIPEPVPLPRPQ